MRSLTESEARVIRALMVDPLAPERQLLKVAGVPRTTFQTIRFRAFASGWLEERFVPDPGLFGLEGVRLVLAQPYAERWTEAVQSMRSLDSLVVLWSSPETLFGVLFEGETSQGWSGVVSKGVFRSSWSVLSPSQSGGVIAYFDFEGAWSKWTLGMDPLAYPRGLPNPKSASPLRSKPERNSVRELLARERVGGPVLSRPSVFRTSGLSRHGRKLLSSGWFLPLILPNLAEIPSIRGYGPSRVVFVTASLLPGKDPRQLFADLAQQAGMAPFVFAFDVERVIFAALSPTPSRVARAPGSVLQLLERHVTKVEVIREPVDSLFPMVDHRYDRLAAQLAPSELGVGSRQ